MLIRKFEDWMLTIPWVSEAAHAELSQFDYYIGRFWIEGYGYMRGRMTHSFDGIDIRQAQEGSIRVYFPSCGMIGLFTPDEWYATKYEALKDDCSR